MFLDMLDKKYNLDVITSDSFIVCLSKESELQESLPFVRCNGVNRQSAL